MPSFSTILSILAGASLAFAASSPRNAQAVNPVDEECTSSVSVVTVTVTQTGAGFTTLQTLTSSTTIAEPITTAVVSSAAPVSATPSAAATPVTSCSEGTTISCCNTVGGGVGILGDVFGGSCSLPNLALLGGLTGGSQCPGANTYCCSTTQTGDLDVNVACLPLSL